MRRIMVSIVVGCGLVAAAVAGPVRAEPTTSSGTSRSAGASWQVFHRARSGGFRVKSWSVFVYRATDGAFAAVSIDVFHCSRAPGAKLSSSVARGALFGRGRRRPECTNEVSRLGVIEEPTTDEFATDDVDGLQSAHLDATVPLRPVDERGRPTGPAVATHVVVDWTGRGDTIVNDATFHHEEPSCTFTDEFHDTFRGADAQGVLGVKNLGRTPFAELVVSSFSFTADGCEDAFFGPLSALREG